jgi:hypothetical protein
VLVKPSVPVMPLASGKPVSHLQADVPQDIVRGLKKLVCERDGYRICEVFERADERLTDPRKSAKRRRQYADTHSSSRHQIPFRVVDGFFGVEARVRPPCNFICVCIKTRPFLP